MKKELEAINSDKITMKIQGREREIKFNFSLWAKLEKEYDGVENVQKVMEETPFNTIPHLLYLALIDKDGVTEDNVLDDYGIGDMKLIMEKLSKAMYGSLPAGDGKEKKAMAEA